MSSSTGANLATNESTKRPRQRRTLQSGFSLLSRGEPKIWLTGGMLVICLSMIVGLLSLIVVNGLATFWPQPVDWLVLNTHEMDIGELQRVEIRKANAEAKESASPAPDQTAPQSSRFYRTANFDITNRHYRWFAPEELHIDGIVRHEWAMVIERMSWGRMMAVPSRLTTPLEIKGDDQQLQSAVACDALLKELSSDLEAIITSSANGNGKSLPALSDLSTSINKRIQQNRSRQLQSAVKDRQPASTGRLEVQTAEGATWQAWQANGPTTVTTTDNDLWAARFVWDRPEEILMQIGALTDKSAKERQTIADWMRAISRLDEQLAHARIMVRQAELDTGRNVLDKVDGVGPFIDALLNFEQLAKRLQDSLQAAGEVLTDAAQAEAWREILRSYQRDTLDPALTAARADLETWLADFSAEPPAIRQAIEYYITAYRQVAEQKRPLEADIQSLQAQSAAAELTVLVPTGATSIELSAENTELLKSGATDDQLRQRLADQSIIAGTDKPKVTQQHEHISVVEWMDPTRGRLELWCITPPQPSQQSSGSAPEKTNSIWLAPPQRVLPCSEIVRLFPANRLSLADKLAIYLDRWREFLIEEPREANTEGGVFPAIWGTVVMTLIMTLAVVPFGVIAALYLREYTRSGPVVSLVRISINNLAGVPSIVYGVFGLAFFCYSIGAFIDGGARNAEFGKLPTNIWYLWLVATVLCGLAAFMIGMFCGGPDHLRSEWSRRLSRIAPLIWLLSLVGVGVLIFKSPFFDGFYEARLPTPTFGKEGLLWASLTLALLTLPVVIVATEEALSAVPNSLREGSLACGASKWQTIYRIVLPHARPGILTGAILAMARGIGEVAPLMLVGALPVAPDLPLDGEFPYFHGSRSFMHLGYQIYWLGFQSQNSEASKPLVFTCTLLLILIVVSLNLSAILLRARLRRRFQGNQF